MHEAADPAAAPPAAPSSAARGDASILAPRAVLAWTLFSLAAGSVNGAAFMACRSFVTHVTGTVTNIGIDAGNPTLLSEYALVLIAFVCGAMLSVIAAEAIPPSRRSLLAIPFVLVFGMLLVVAIAGTAGAFGPFGARNTETTGAFALLALLAGAMGIQNAAVAVATANMVRTTHLTGPATDLAANVVRAVLDRGQGKANEARWAALRFVKIVAFALGAAIAARYASQYEYRIFSMPAAFVMLAFGLTFAPEPRASDTEAVESAVTASDGSDGSDVNVVQQERDDDRTTKPDEAA